MTLFKPGDEVTIIETHNGRLSEYLGFKVLEYDNGLLTVRNLDGKHVTYNMRSYNIHAIRKEE